MAIVVAVVERTLASARAHPLLVDVVIAVAVTGILLALVPGLAIVAIGLIALALSVGVVFLLRRRTAQGRGRRSLERHAGGAPRHR